MKVMRSQSKWTGQVERMEGVRLTKRADALRVEGRRRMQRLRWEACVKRDLAGVRARDGGMDRDGWWSRQ